MECGECTLCCKVLYVPEIEKKAGTECKYVCDGCAIYEKRPTSCQEFQCAYSQMEKVNIALRPDKCGAVFEKLADDLVIGTVEPKRESYPHMMGQVKSFNKTGANVVLIENGISSVFPIKGVSIESVLSRVM